MENTPFATFIELVRIDQSINSEQKKIVDLEKKSNEFVRQKKQLQDDFAIAGQKVHDAQKEVDIQELEMKTLDQQEAEKKNLLENISSQKEYVSVKSEIDHLKKKQHALEDTLVQAWHELETAKKHYAEYQTTNEHKVKESDEQIQKVTDEIQKLQQDIEIKKQERAPIEKRVPEEWLEKYSYMRTRVTDPVVPVVSGACGACFFQIPASDIIALEHRKLLQCKDCFRLLYIESAQGVSAAKGGNS